MLKKSKKKPTLSSLKEKVWVLFSQYIRLRDCLLTTGLPDYGKCITCGRDVPRKLLQAGHFISGRHNANLFSEEGCHAQCYNCNINLKGKTLEYRRQIIKLYGKGYDEVLEKRANEIKKFTPSELEELIVDLRNKLKILESK